MKFMPVDRREIRLFCVRIDTNTASKECINFLIMMYMDISQDVARARMQHNVRLTYNTLFYIGFYNIYYYDTAKYRIS